MTYVHTSDRLWSGQAAPENQGFFGRITHALEDRRARRELADLPPHLLRDIGLVEQGQHAETEARTLVNEINRTVASTGAVW